MFAKKSLGQNFLMHPQIAERIVHVAGVGADDTVLEIGPGTGMLTRALLAVVHKVIAVEADDVLVPQLEETFKEAVASGKLVLVHDDIRAFDTAYVVGAYHVVANIPYYLTGEIIRSFLTASHKPSSMTLLVQKEVAERIVRSKKESLLSLSVKAYGTPSYGFTVPKGAFKPAPMVDSAVISIRDIRADAFPSAEAEAWFFKVLHAGFAHKRKQLAKNLEELAPRERVLAAFHEFGLAPTTRSEDVSLASWRALAAMLSRAR